jgi:hypothetical protein
MGGIMMPFQRAVPFPPMLDLQTNTTITFFQKRADFALCMYQGRLYKFYCVYEKTHETTQAHILNLQGKPVEWKDVWNSDRFKMSDESRYLSVVNSKRKYVGFLDPMVSRPFIPGVIQDPFHGTVLMKRIQRWWRRVYITPQRQLALCMGMHERLGQNSVLQILSPELLVKLLA